MTGEKVRSGTSVIPDLIRDPVERSG